MFNTIAISELQKSLSKILKSTKGFVYILSNNKVKGALIGKDLMHYLDETGVLEEYEDMMLLQKGKEASEEGRKILESGDLSECLTFDELCQSS